MAEKTLKDAFYETLKDVYFAEKSGTRATKRAIKAAQTPALKTALTQHSEESARHVERLNRVFELLGKSARSKTCKAMSGISDEMDDDLRDFDGTEAGDDVLIGCQQAVEHYEIARYGMLRTWAKKLGLSEAATVLGETLEEEKRADERLTQIAEGLAASGADEDLEAEDEPPPVAAKPKSRARAKP